jgi:FMN-dependent NADH-azoreductase
VSTIDLRGDGPVLLHLDTGLRREGSTSRRLAEAFRAAWEAASPEGRTVHRDLAVDPVPHQDEAGWIAGMLPPEARTPEQAASWAITEPLVAELEAADEVLLSVPMYNLGVPSAFKAWIDRVVIVGRTLGAERFASVPCTVVSARGGAYGPGTPREGWDHQEPYLRAILGALGFQDLEVIHAELTFAGADPNLAGLEDLATTSLERALERAAARGGRRSLATA